MNHRRPNMDRQKEYGIAFGEAVLSSSPPSRSQMDDRLESGFGGRADEKTQTAREAVALLDRKKSHPQHLTISHLNRINSNISAGKSLSLFIKLLPDAVDFDFNRLNGEMVFSAVVSRITKSEPWNE